MQSLKNVYSILKKFVKKEHCPRRREGCTERLHMLALPRIFRNCFYSAYNYLYIHDYREQLLDSPGQIYVNIFP